MTAMFIAIFTEQWLKEKKKYTGLIGIGATLLCLCYFWSKFVYDPVYASYSCFTYIIQKPISKAYTKTAGGES